MPDPFSQLESRPTLEELLSTAAASRERTVDDHMFRAGEVMGVPCTFRLQLFTAPGERPVAVATQLPDEGASLINRAERYAAQVWRAHCASEQQPPIWIQHLLPDEGFTFVPFDVTGQYELGNPGWQDISVEQLAHLVGRPVDVARGDGYIPHVPPPPDRLQYEVMQVSDLPEARPFRTWCMPTRTSLRRLAARLVRWVKGPSRCCWYHDQDWLAVSELAILVVEQARRDGLADDEISEEIVERARGLGGGERELPAVVSLLSPATAIVPHLGPEPSYTNGNHRARAMHDAGVERTVVVSYLPAEDETD
ncbi:hypothetical protein [Streptomyces sp. NPDC029004]|uniref:hypothetical protein n=1 Tax=Streptomyces sp. NPDC029004 TaxID=3154490 RepID=UPI0033F1082C